MTSIALREPAADYLALCGERTMQETPALAERPEMEWQARWFAGDFGTHFTTTDGQAVEIVQFGVWNRGAGPDFLDSAVRFDNGAPQRGAIELDLDAADWERHGHAINPDFEGVILHLFANESSARESFTRTSLHRLVPRVRLDPARLEDGAPAQAALAKPGRCSAPLREFGPGRAESLLLAAARHRMQRKSNRWLRLVAAHGDDEAFYQLLAMALGFRENQLPFQLLAQRLPLRLLRAHPAAAAAWLMGLSGFLRGREFGADAVIRRRYLRETWELWWPRRAEWERLILGRGAWRLGGTRPSNHPQRRLAALAAIVRAWPRVRAILKSKSPTTDAIRVFGALSDSFWEHHFTLASARRTSRIALLGSSRIAEILANVIYPAIVPRRPAAWQDYLRLPAELTNRRVETAAARLFGGNAVFRRSVPATVAVQQGLLQIYEDFCLRDASDCAHCTFPERVKAWSPDPAD
jgi:Protein of unknown function (DUF2851)